MQSTKINLFCFKQELIHLKYLLIPIYPLVFYRLFIYQQAFHRVVKLYLIARILKIILFNVILTSFQLVETKAWNRPKK